jgi:hypothetical protein
LQPLLLGDGLSTAIVRLLPPVGGVSLMVAVVVWSVFRHRTVLQTDFRGVAPGSWLLALLPFLRSFQVGKHMTFEDDLLSLTPSPHPRAWEFRASRHRPHYRPLAP